MQFVIECDYYWYFLFQLCEFITNPAGDLTCYPVRTFLGGQNQVQLTKSKLLSHPEKATSSLVCAGDEDAQGVST